VSTLLQDLKHALRVLGRNPGFTAVAIITLALGIGATTAIFSVIYGVLLRPLPYPQPDRIAEISVTYRGQVQPYSGFTANAFDFWKQHSQPFQYLSASTNDSFSLAGAGRPERVTALRVSSEYFHVFGVQPFLGRNFNAQEEQIGGPNVAILSYGLWKEHFAGDPHAIGRTVLLNGAPFTVIGVMPAGFVTLTPSSPIQTAPLTLWTTIGQVRNGAGSGQNYDVIGRLKANVSRTQADAYLAGVARNFVDQNYRWMSEADRKIVGFAAVPYTNVISSSVRTPLLVLFGAIGFVLLIACVNVANLLLARTAARSREVAVRTALGARRGRIVRQLLTESVLLAIFGAGAGLLVAFWSLHSLLALAPSVLPRAQHIGLNGWALLFTAGVAIAAGILFGLAPALEASRTNLNESLKEGARRASVGRGRRRLSDGMVSVEVALSLILLIGAGLLIVTFTNLLRTNPGFDPHDMLALSIWTTGSKYNSMPDLASFYQDLVRRMDAIPGVQSTAVVSGGLPLETGLNLNPGVRVGNEITHPSVDFREVTPDYFRTLRDAAVAGRPFTPADSSDSTKVTIINAAFARRFFPNENPIGHHLLDGQPLEIVGVAGDVRSSLTEQAPPTYFIPITQADFRLDQGIQGWFPVYILIRTSVKPLSLSHAVGTAVRSAGPNIPIGHIQSMEQVLSVSIAFNRFLMALMSIFGVLAVVLAAIGIYGVLSYAVSQRVHEIGIRMALGARRGDVLRLIVAQGMRMALIGVGAGVVAALLLAHLIANQLYEVQAADPLTFIIVALVLIAIAFAATYIPARRATKVDPVVALRYE
jgi:putative ABC transport system permease protein